MRKLEERIFKVLMIISSLVIMSVLLYILWIIIRRGLPSLTWDMVSKVPSGGFYLGKEGGILNAIVGSLYLIFGSVLISTLISLPVALYINFLISKKSRFSSIVRFSFDILFGIPSIVYGAFGFMVMIYLGIQASLLGGIIAVSLLIIPIMVRSIDEVAVYVPKDLIEAPLSLGATKFETLKVVVRQILPGITTAILLAVGRGIGDAATVLFTAGYTDSINLSPAQPAATLPLAIFFQLSSPIEEVQNRAYAAALILTIIILVISFSTRYFGNKLSKSKV
ncbi:MAG TPA: phosphate ABC transporter permease PstA [Tenuifilaceae bacterium]|nr:phosphate ABC transporter permease PstA [Tenuifilaceae bacterium]HOZ14186.1 phosphate ABC transporter permease PstA [Tenuifilaceae bacterium]HPI43662.1 phosphate ABC transporter permease PstA [Tenuifilaceae bacterium]HPN21654.1 phosphate ABC transporter permease PstA [Tenuifilaceae bacterium]HPV55937.1 phosphate ABC transporter permease PstA [Tenuifilaceae bacterium]